MLVFSSHDVIRIRLLAHGSCFLPQPADLHENRAAVAGPRTVHYALNEAAICCLAVLRRPAQRRICLPSSIASCISISGGRKPRRGIPDCLFRILPVDGSGRYRQGAKIAATTSRRCVK